MNETPCPKSLQSGRGVEAAGPQKVRKTQEGAGAPRRFRSLPSGLPLTAQQLHTRGDAVLPSYGQDTHKVSQEGHLKHILVVGIIVQVAWEDLEAERVSGGPQSQRPPLRDPGQWGGEGSQLAVYGPRVPVLNPVHAIVTVGHLVGCHILDVAKVSGPLHDNAGHLPLGAQVNLLGEKTNAFSLLGRPPLR